MRLLMAGVLLTTISLGLAWAGPPHNQVAADWQRVPTKDSKPDKRIELLYFLTETLEGPVTFCVYSWDSSGGAVKKIKSATILTVKPEETATATDRKPRAAEGETCSFKGKYRFGEFLACCRSASAESYPMGTLVSATVTLGGLKKMRAALNDMFMVQAESADAGIPFSSMPSVLIARSPATAARAQRQLTTMEPSQRRP